MLRSRHIRAGLAVLVLALALPVAASADPLTDIIKNIGKNLASGSPGIEACAFTAKQLSTAYGEIPIDEQQYSPDLGRAIQAALRAHTAGACDKKPAATQTTTTGASAPPASTTTRPKPPSGPSSSSAGTGASTPTATPEPPPVPASLLARKPVPVAALRVSRSEAGTPAALIALAATATALALFGLAVLAVRRLGLAPRWTRPLRHAFSEAGWRTAGTWEDFSDWLRLGR